MNNKLSLSYSQITTYKDCPRKWYLNKVEKIRPNYLSSSLFFGSIVDEILEHILLKKEESYKDMYNELSKSFKLNGKTLTLPEDILYLKFFNSDLDPNLITKEYVKKTCKELDLEYIELGEFLDYYKKQKRKRKTLNDKEQRLFNLLAYKSLLIKGELILEELLKWTEENVVEVHSVQKKINIENEIGDNFVGYLDFIVTLKNNKKVLIDLKTSSDPKRYYPEDSASKSPQLGIYSQEEEVPEVAYLVCDKKIRKRNPRVRLHFIEGKITEEHLNDVFDEIENITTEIKRNLPYGKPAFSMNKNSCYNYGGCEYFNHCLSGCMKGLVKVEG